MAIALVAMGACGCADSSAQPASSQAEVPKTRTDPAAEAMQRFPYKADAPRAVEPKARAQAEYVTNRLDIVNFSGEDWEDVELWVNGRYVCHLPKMEDRQLKEIPFPMLFDEAGRSFPLDNRRERIQKVELYRNGTMYSIVCHVRDW